LIPIVAVVGTADSGKTTLVVRLVAELSARGLRIATIKHHHGEFEIDHEGKDSFKHRQAGARQVIINSPTQTAFMRHESRERALEEIVGELIDDIDLVIAEGFKRAPVTKIEVVRPDQPGAELVRRDDPHLVAVVGAPSPREGVAAFKPDDVAALADFIVKRYLPKKPRPVRLVVDGRRIVLNEFAAGILANTIRGAVSALRDCDHPHTIRLDISTDESAD
jgi:molybdopterin-guanine dinucleotide biosynthesis protein B